LSQNGAQTPASNQTVLYLEVKASRGWFPPTKPLRIVPAVWPRYQQDLRNYPIEKVAKPMVGNQNASDFTTTLLYDDGFTLNQDQVLQRVGQEKQGMAQPKINVNLPPSQQNEDTAYSWKKWPIRFTINNQTFRPPSHPSSDQSPAAMHDVAYQALIPTARVIQFMPGGLAAHAWHMHTHPVQIQSFEGVGHDAYKELYGGYFEVGDWFDTIMLPKGPGKVKVRFQTDCYSGPLVIHCHILPHEDIGMFTLVYSTGRNYQYNDEFRQDGIFKFAPKHCQKRGANCATPWCTNYKY
jgi:hypothetical protein